MAHISCGTDDISATISMHNGGYLTADATSFAPLNLLVEGKGDIVFKNGCTFSRGSSFTADGMCTVTLDNSSALPGGMGPRGGTRIAHAGQQPFMSAGKRAAHPPAPLSMTALQEAMLSPQKVSKQKPSRPTFPSKEDTPFDPFAHLPKETRDFLNQNQPWQKRSQPQRATPASTTPARKQPSFTQVRTTLLSDDLYKDRSTRPAVSLILSSSCSETERTKLWYLYLFRMLNFSQQVRSREGNYTRILNPKKVFTNNWQTLQDDLVSGLTLGTMTGVFSALLFGFLKEDAGRRLQRREAFNVKNAAIAFGVSEVAILLASIAHHYSKKPTTEYFRVVEGNQRSIFNAHSKDMPEAVQRKLKRFLENLTRLSAGREGGAPKDVQRTYQKLFCTFADDLRAAGGIATEA